MDSSPISSKKAPKPVGLYPHARKVGNLLFLSGVGPRIAQSDIHDSFIPKLELDHNGNFINFDFEAQCHSVFQNVKTILEDSGSSWENLVDITVFLVDMKREEKYGKLLFGLDLDLVMTNYKTQIIGRSIDGILKTHTHSLDLQLTQN